MLANEGNHADKKVTQPLASPDSASSVSSAYTILDRDYQSNFDQASLAESALSIATFKTNLSRQGDPGLQGSSR